MNQVEELRKELLGFAAFATIGDVMVLMDENRILVKHGLKYMEETSNIGLKALLDATQLAGKKLEVYHVGFILGPCINATGRLDSAARAFSLFACSDHRECVQIASELKELNDSRKSMTLENTEKAMQIIQEKGFAKDGIIVVYLEQCHESLAGIIAGRLREKFYKPVFVSDTNVFPVFKVTLLFSATYTCDVGSTFPPETGKIKLLSINKSELFAPYNNTEFAPIELTFILSKFVTFTVLSLI